MKKATGTLISGKIRYFAIVVILVNFFSLLGCNVDEEKKTLYENEQSIIQNGDSYFYSSRTEKVDDRHIDIKYDSFYGVQTLWSFQAEEGSVIKIAYNSVVKEGSFKVVLVTPEQEIMNIVEQSNKGAFNVAANKGKNYIKIVGKNAKGNLQIDLED